MPITYFSQPEDYREKERLYLEVRSREGRVLSDEALKQLPEVKSPAALAREWRWRKRNFERFDAYLNRHYPDRLVRVLDLGCGNGWMSNLIALNQLRSVTAVDLNEMELIQGSRVFRQHNLQFAFGAGGFRAVFPRSEGTSDSPARVTCCKRDHSFSGLPFL
jgi:SAM-dependent methyltransferase